MSEADNLLKSSAHGVRDFPMSPKTKNNKNEDIDDVYDHVSTKKPADFSTNKETVSVSGTKTKKKKRILNKNHSMDFITDPYQLPSKQFIYHHYNTDLDEMTPEDQMEFVNKENEKLLEKVTALGLGLKSFLQKAKEKQDSKPPQVFMKTNDDYKGM